MGLEGLFNPYSKIPAIPNPARIPLRCAGSTNSTVCNLKWEYICIGKTELTDITQQKSAEIKKRIWASRLFNSYYFIIMELNPLNEGALNSQTCGPSEFY
jgi:hypothetical protein